MGTQKTDTATLGAGCFWCTEAVFSRVRGVVSVTSGYSGGHLADPTYRQVCDGTTGHAEVIQIVFHPEVISFAELLEIFFATHDPTTRNRQGNDVGTQYRSVIFYHHAAQQQQAIEVTDRINKSGNFASPIVTEIKPFTVFYPAEDYHQDYFSANQSQPYCVFVISPKIDKLTKYFKPKLKVE